MYNTISLKSTNQSQTFQTSFYTESGGLSYISTHVFLTRVDELKPQLFDVLPPLAEAEGQYLS